MHHRVLMEALGIPPALIESRRLLPCAEAARLEVAEVASTGREHLLTPEAASAWRQMKSAAAEESVDLFIVSAFRSVERQVDIVRGKLKAGQKIEEILCVSAPPGYSEHHTGCAVDVGTPGTPDLEEGFALTAAFGWLQRRAAEFGFRLSYPENNPHGYRYEPWHWCSVPTRGR